MNMIRSSEIIGNRSTEDIGWQPLEELFLRLPNAADPMTMTLILNAPIVGAIGGEFPGAGFRILLTQGRGQPEPEVIALGQLQARLRTTAVPGSTPLTIVRTMPYSDPEGSSLTVEWRAIGTNTRAQLDPFSIARNLVTASLTAMLVPE